MTGEQMRKIRLRHGITFKDLRLDECPETQRIDKTLYSKIEHGYADPTPELQNRFLSVVASLGAEIPAGTAGTHKRAVATREMDIPRQTRRESYEAMDRETRKREILAVLDGREMTAREIAEKLGFHERNAAAPRLTELRKAGRVEPCGIRIDGTTGRSVTVWRTVERREGNGR